MTCMTAEILNALTLASVGILVATTGAAVLILHLLMGPELRREIDDDFRGRHQG
jgi:hypothetical protein